MMATPTPRPVQLELSTPSVCRNTAGATTGPAVGAIGKDHGHDDAQQAADDFQRDIQHAANDSEQAAQQAVRTDDGVGRNRQDGVVAGERPRDPRHERPP